MKRRVGVQAKLRRVALWPCTRLWLLLRRRSVHFEHHSAKDDTGARTRRAVVTGLRHAGNNWVDSTTTVRRAFRRNRLVG